MFHLLTNKKFILIFGLITLAIFIVSLTIKPAASLPEVVKTDPANHATKVDYFDSIGYTFNQDVDPNLLKLTSIPEETWQQLPTNSRKITYTPTQYFQVNTQYALTLSYDNRPIHNLTFTTLAQQSDPRYVQEVNNELKRDYPLAVKTPLERPGFSAVYSKPLTLEITLKEGVDERSEIINAVRDWVKENGLDPDTHTYIFSN